MSSAAAEEKTETAAAPAGPAASAGGGKLVMLLTLVNTVVAVGIIGVLLVSLRQQKRSLPDIVVDSGAPSAAKGAKTPAPAASEIGTMLPLDQFTVNLSTPGSSASAFVRVDVSLELSGDETKDEATAKMPEIRNVIIDLFNSKRASDLSTADGRDYLKEEIQNALNGFLVHGKVKGVFFTNFALTG